MSEALAAEVQSESPTPTVPKDLQDKLNATRSLVVVHELLQKGTFPAIAFAQVTGSIGFVEILHKTLIDECLAHPEAHTSSELEQLKKERADGQKE